MVQTLRILHIFVLLSSSFFVKITFQSDVDVEIEYRNDGKIRQLDEDEEIGMNKFYLFFCNVIPFILSISS